MEPGKDKPEDRDHLRHDVGEHGGHGQGGLQGLLMEGAQARLLLLRSNHRSDVIEEMLDAKGVLLGSPTLNNGMFPTMGDFLTYMKGLRPKGKFFGLFGSHGWGGGALKEMRKFLSGEKFEVWEEELPAQFLPSPEELEKAVLFGRNFAKRSLEADHAGRPGALQSNPHGSSRPSEECRRDESPDGVGEVKNPACGDIMRLYIKVEADRIVDVRFLTYGCGPSIAASSMTTEMIKGKSVTEALAVSKEAVSAALGGLPPPRATARLLPRRLSRRLLSITGRGAKK